MLVFVILVLVTRRMRLVRQRQVDGQYWDGPLAQAPDLFKIEPAFDVEERRV
jgi:hypothetical protein